MRRSEQSRESYGPNVDILIRPDSQIFVVQTELGYLMTYSLATDPNATVYRPHLVNAGHHARQQSLSAMGRTAVGPSGIALGTGEAGGVREYSLQFRMVIKVDAGIQKYVRRFVRERGGADGVGCWRWKMSLWWLPLSRRLFSV